MSEGDIAVVLEALRVWRSTGQPAWALTHPDVEVHDHDLMDAGEYRGREGVERWLADWESAWAEYGMDAEELIEAGEGRVLVLVRMRATGRESTVTVERDDAILYELCEGLILRLDYFNDRTRALAAAGLSG